MAGAPIQFTAGSSGPYGAEFAQQFSFTPINAAYVKFQILTNYPGSSLGNITGLSEVQFNSAILAAAPVPEPFTIIGSLIGGTAAFRMKKKLANPNKA